VAVVTGLSGNVPTTVTDNKGDIYVQAYGTTSISGHYSSDLYYLANAPAGITTITITENADTAGGAIAAHYSGVATASPLDVFSAPSKSGALSPWTSNAITTTQANDLLVGSVFATNGTANCAIGASGNWTQDASIANNGALDAANGSAMAYAHQIVYTIQTNIQNTGTDSAGNCANYAGIAAFKSGSTGTTSTISLTNSGNGSVTSNPAGINCGSTCSMVVNNGTSVTLTATPNSGYVTSWSSCGSTTSGNTCTLSVNTNTTVNVAFNLPDTTPPTISVASPANNATISGTISVSGTASDNVSVSSVQISIDGGAYQSAQGTTNWTYSLNTAGLSNGSHTIVAKGTDPSGNVGTSGTVTVTVSNSTGGGGSCPAAANYLNPITNTLVTLSSLGVTHCYYVAANGSDSNLGTSESSPWMHAPGMPSCSANCLVAQNQSNGIPPGTGLIFRGGDTWHFGNPSASPYTGGTWSFNTSPYPNGTSNNPIYVGVDQSWYSGGSWARPVLTGDNPPCSLSTLSGTCIKNTNAALSEVVYVTSCPYQNAPGGTGGDTNDLMSFDGRQYITFDNFELTGLCESDANDVKSDKFINYNSATGIVFANLYIHGWTHLPFNVNGDCDQVGGSPGATSVCLNISFFAGSAGPPAVGETIAKTVVDGSDSDPAGAGLFFPGFYNTYDNVFRYVGQGVYRDLHVFHDNLLEHWYQPGDNAAHGNLMESDGEYPSTDAIYNNLFRNICTDSNACPSGIVGILPQTPIGQKEYVFNNVAYSDINIEGPMGMGGPVNLGTLVYFNNTLEHPGSGSLFSCYGSDPPTVPWTSANDNLISDTANPYTINCTNQELALPLTDSVMTNAVATTDGYTTAESFAYSPASANSQTVGVGTNEEGFCNTMLGSGDPLVQAAGTACKSDTTYGVGYNAANHTVIFPARTPIARPTSGAWDVGAYQYSSSGGGGGGGGDTTPPTTSITSPANNGTVSGTITVQASASDNVGVTQVQLFVDGSLQSTDNASPYTFSLNTNSLTNGSHTLVTKAYDAAGNVGTSATITVTVSNIPQTLTASLAASSLSGIAPLTTSLTATAGGTAQGTISYIFYCNRSDTGVNITAPADLTVSATTTNPLIAANLCSYQTAGTYTAKVIVEQGSASPAEAQQTITVSSPSSTSTPSLISGVTVGQITQISAQVTITTTQSAAIQVNYGVNTGYGNTTALSPYLTTTYVNLTSLSPGTTYHFDVTANPVSGNPATSGDFSFTTQSVSSSGGGGGGGGGGGSTPPSSGGGGGGGSGGASLFTVTARVTTSTRTTAEITVTNSLPAITELFYGPSLSYGSTTQQSPLLATSYFNLTGLIPNTLYYLRAVSLASNETMSQSITFTPGSGTSIPITSSASLPSFTRNLTIGSVGSDVMELQELLNQWGYTITASGPGSPGHESTYFGSLTTKAVQKFQSANHISPVSGFVGTLTRGKLNQLIGASTAQPPTAITTGGTITETLAPGSSGSAVTTLQTLLTTDGDYAGPITGYYGLLTETAVEHFQTKEGIISYGSPDTTGYGAVGPRTRAALGE
jgi:peptidoglycan hydrolase-like protein with peptidoglycan-binding domain